MASGTWLDSRVTERAEAGERTPICRRKHESSLWVKDTPGSLGTLQCMGLGWCPEDGSSLVRRKPSVCKSPIEEMWGKGPSGCHCRKFLISSSEFRNRGWQPGPPRQEAGWRDGCLTRAGQEVRELVRVKTKKTWKGSDAVFLTRISRRVGLSWKWMQILYVCVSHPSSPD